MIAVVSIGFCYICFSITNGLTDGESMYQPLHNIYLQNYLYLMHEGEMYWVSNIVTLLLVIHRITNTFNSVCTSLSGFFKWLVT
jgi:hypothetical protein